MKLKNLATPVVTTGPSATYTEYKPDLATRLAMERAKRDQPPMIPLGSNVPALPYDRIRMHD